MRTNPHLASFIKENELKENIKREFNIKESKHFPERKQAKDWQIKELKQLEQYWRFYEAIL